MKAWLVNGEFHDFETLLNRTMDLTGSFCSPEQQFFWEIVKS